MRGVLVGCGWIAPAHLRAWAEIDGVEIAAVADLNPRRAEELASRFGVTRVFADAAKAMEEVRPDFMDIAAGPGAHPDLVDLGVEAGCHVLCQKPLAVTLPAAERIVAAERRSKTVVAVNEMWKWLPAYRVIAEMVRGGLLGTIRRARFKVACNLMLPEADGGPPMRLRDGGQTAFRTQLRVLLFDFGMHPIDLLRSLLGCRAEVIAASVSRVSPALAGDDGAFVALRFESGAVAEIDLDWSRPGPRARDTIDDETLMIEGTVGSVAVRGARTITWYPVKGAGWTRTVRGDRRLLAFKGSQQDFVDAVRSGTAPASPPSEHVENLRIALAAYAMAGW